MTQEQLQQQEAGESAIKSIKEQISTEKEIPEAGSATVPEAEKEGEEGVVSLEGEERKVPSLEEAADLFAAGAQALALANYEEAAEKLALAVEAQ